MTAAFADRRDLDFLLFEWLQVQDAEHSVVAWAQLAAQLRLIWRAGRARAGPGV